MVKRRLTGLFALLLPLSMTHALIGGDKGKDSKKKRSKMEQAIMALPDSAYENVKKEDLLNDEVYIKLARDGWYPQEITRIMDRYIKSNRQKIRGSFEYGMYAKQWLPSFGHTPGNDTIYQYVDTAYREETMKEVRRMYARQLETYYPEIPYTPDDRMSGKRNTGYFRPVWQKPYTGRIHWIVVHPTDPDALMVVPDGAGIFRTSNLGETWDCVTDRIPDREFRKICSHSAIPVDPDNWDHFFAFMKNGNTAAVYETQDGGQTWVRVPNATHKSFKRGYAFKDAAGNLKFIGANQGGGDYRGSKVWYSDDKGVTWKEIVVPEDLKEVHPTTGAKGSFFQNFAFHPTNRNLVYIPTSRCIYYFDDGVTPQTDASGNTVFNIKRMTFDVYNHDGTELRASQVHEFPFKATTQGFLEINPNNPLQMWFATASRNVSYGVYSAVYRSDDGGKTWRTLQEPMNGIGSGLAFGNESPWGWLGGFGVNFQDPQWLYGCSMSSAISSDGGYAFKEFGWGNRLKAKADDGVYYTTTSARHNADNHCIVSHRSGRVFRGSDAGLLVKDKAINNHEWTNINSSMGNQLHYSIKVNEFGDQTMLGNTQDVDAQTYRYGRWGHWRGYEGTEAFINPYAGTCYFSGSGGGGLEGVSLSSWYEGYTMADVCTGYWYLIHNPGNSEQSFFRIEDFGRKTVNISLNTVDESGAGKGARDFAITRDGDCPTLFVLNTNHTIVRSTDNGNTFETVKVKSKGNIVPAKFSNAWIAADPNNCNAIYVAQTGKVLKYDLSTGDMEDLSEGLPNISCEDIFFHEGSGDLYFFSSSSGIYLRDHTTGKWSLWMKGYNPLSAKRLALNYTTQEMVIGDYGRGVWVADLEHPSDRYFKNGFQLKELSNVSGRRTLGIDTKWTIPLYYDYTWYVNGEDVSNPYQYLTKELKEGDQVKLKLTLRESPDVSTESAVYTVQAASSGQSVDYVPTPGQALYSDGRGRIDLGNVDYFFNDFTIDLWIKPENNGVILCNRPVELQRDTRGWALLVDQGVLKFRYAPAQLFDRATYDANIAQQEDLSGGQISMGKWSHVALSQDRDGKVTLYINGNEVASKNRIVQWAPLNSAVNLSLFADGFESMPIKGAVDELKIWNKALSANDIRRAMFSHETSQSASLVYCNDFNAGSLDKEAELYSRMPMKPRTQAVTEHIKMPVVVGAIKSEVKTPQGRTAYDTGSGTFIYLTPEGGQAPETGVYRYKNLRPDSMGVDTRYYTVASEVFQIRPFGETGDVQVDVELPLSWKQGKQYQLYAAGIYENQKVWRKIVNLEAGEEGRSLIARGVRLDQLKDRMLAVLENKAAIEPTLAGNWENNVVTVYHYTQNSYTVEATLVGGMKEPAGVYELRSKNGLFKIADGLKFVNGKATGKLQLDVDKLQGAEVMTDTIVGKSNSDMVPLCITVQNKMLPFDAGKVLTINGGGAALHDSKVSQNLNGINTITMMGWIRLNDASMLSRQVPLIFFRGSNGGVCGLHLASGNVRLHWNDGYYGWSTDLNIKSADLGRWMHVAVVIEPKGFHWYLNGTEHYRSENVALSKINSSLMLGQDFVSDRWCKVSFDQVMVFNRSLSSSEVRYYMTDNPRLDDENLVVFLDMDRTNEKGNIYDQVTGTELTRYGVTSNEDYLHVPYHPVKSLVQGAQDTEGDQLIYLKKPQGVNIPCEFDVMNGTSYNYVNPEHANLNPLVNSHYTYVKTTTSTFTAGQKAVLSFNMPESAVNEGAVLAMRLLGISEPFDTFIPMQNVENGKMRFEMDATLLNEPREMMLMYDAATGTRPVRVSLSVPEYEEGDTVFLDAVTDQILIKAKVLSANPDSKVLLSVVESEYASLDKTELDMGGQSEQDIKLTIDKEKLNKLALNPVSIRLTGVTDQSDYNFNVALEPIVKLTLADQTEETDSALIVTSPYPSLSVKAKLLQGVLREPVKIKTNVDVPSQINTSVGHLLSNNPVMLADNLEYYPSKSEFDAGWNLVGNPYLSNVNLTKEQNVQISEDEIVKYMYLYNAENDTYTAWDMVENYDETQKVMPFQPFFIQTKQQRVSMVITPEAKNTSINRKVFDHYMLHESKMLRLGLYLGDSDQIADQTEVKIQEETSSDFILGEDAMKMWGGMNSKSNEMATVSGKRYVSVNVLPDRMVEIPLYLRLNATGKCKISVIKSYGYGLNDKAMLIDKQTGQSWNLLDGDGYEFEVKTPAEAATRFVLSLNLDDATDVEQAELQKPVVTVNGGVCRVEGLSGKSVVEFFDTSGRRQAYLTTDKTYVEQTLRSGNYIVRVRTSNKDFSNKINVR